MDSTVNEEGFQDDANDDDVCVPRPRKSKRRLVQLLHLRPDVWFRTAAVIGPPDSPTYVIEVVVDGQVMYALLQLACISIQIGSSGSRRMCLIVVH